MINKIIPSPQGPFTLKKLANITKDQIVGNANINIKNIESLEEAKSNSLTFIDNKKYISSLANTKASACIISENIYNKYASNLNITFLISKSPYLSYARLLKEFYPNLKENVISDNINMKVMKSSNISKNAHIKDNVSIGKNSLINSFSSIGPNVYIGDNCYIGNNVSISNTYIGNNVNIQDGTIIGQDGFGYAFDGKKNIKIPQIGIVKIGNFVEVGCNCTIDRGSLSFTEIEDGVKIDNLVHIAHNVTIGRNTMIAGQSGIAGSSNIGSQVLIGGQVGIAGHINIDDNVQIGAQSGVTKNIAKNNIVSGTPSVNIKTYLKQAILLKNMVEKK